MDVSGDNGVAVIVGVGPGLGAALARRFAAGGLRVAIVARRLEKVAEIAAGIDGARAFACDVSDEAEVEALFASIEAEIGPVEVAVHNASAGHGKVSVLEVDAARFRAAWNVSAFGGFLVGRAAARRMVERGHGSILFTGATASLRGSSGFGAFAQGKFALRAITQSMARELGPMGIHVGHVVIDGHIGEKDDASYLSPDAIAETYWNLHVQERSAWSFEVDLRPWLETF